MLQTSQTDYKSILSEFLQHQILIFGPQAVKMMVSGVNGLDLEKDGMVKNITGDPQKIMQEVAERLSQLSEYAVKTTFDRILVSHSVEDTSDKPDTTPQI